MESPVVDLEESLVERDCIEGSAEVERALADALDALRDSDRLQLGATIESPLAQTLDAARELDSGDAGASSETALVDLLDASRDGDGGQRGAMRKSFFAYLFNIISSGLMGDRRRYSDGLGVLAEAGDESYIVFVEDAVAQTVNSEIIGPNRYGKQGDENSEKGFHMY